VGKTEGTAGLQKAAHRSTFLNFPELVLAVAPGHARPATLTLLASVGCASLARSRALEKREPTTVSSSELSRPHAVPFFVICMLWNPG